MKRIKPIYAWKNKPARLAAVFTTVPVVVVFTLLALPLAMLADAIFGLLKLAWSYLVYLSRIPKAGYASAKATIRSGYRAIKSSLED